MSSSVAGGFNMRWSCAMDTSAAEAAGPWGLASCGGAGVFLNTKRLEIRESRGWWLIGVFVSLACLGVKFTEARRGRLRREPPRKTLRARGRLIFADWTLIFLRHCV